MRNKKAINFLIVILFILVFSLAINTNGSMAEDTSDTSENTEATRTADWYKQDAATNAWGGITQQFSFGPDIGFGETGSGYRYYDPYTGASVSYSTTGIGMGSIWAPTYGGIGSPLGTASYGPFVTGQVPELQPTYGYDTQSSFAGSAFGQGYQYSFAQPNYIAQLSQSLIQNPLSMGTSLALAFLSSGFGGYSGYGYSGLGYGYPNTYGSYSGYTGGYGLSRPYYGYGYY